MCFQWLGVKRTHPSQFDTVHTFQVCCSGSQWVVSDPQDAGLWPGASPEEWRKLPALPARCYKGLCLVDHGTPLER